MKAFVYIVITIVAVAIAANFFIIGTPGNERLRRFDSTRVSDLSMTQNEIINFWVNKNRLPKNLKELESDLGYFTVPADPETGAQYEYKILGQYQFELCANFNTDNQGETNFPETLKRVYPYAYESRWIHGVGRTCFTRTIDPELYKKDDGLKGAIPARPF